MHHGLQELQGPAVQSQSQHWGWGLQGRPRAHSQPGCTHSTSVNWSWILRAGFRSRMRHTQ